MSVIADYMIVVDGYEDDAIKALNQVLFTVDAGRHQQFRQINMDGAGGSKVYTCDVWAAAFNHLIPSAIDDAIMAAPWRFPEEVVVVMSGLDYDIDLHSRTVAEMRMSAEQVVAAPPSKACVNPPLRLPAERP